LFHVQPIRWRSLLLALLLLLTPSSAWAHGTVPEQIAAISQQIESDLRNAGLYLKRGQLYSDLEDWKAALDDYQRAANLDPRLSIVDLARGKTLFRAGRLSAAKDALDRFLRSTPVHAEALVLRARTLAQLGSLDASVSDYTRAIAHLARQGHPNPDYYLERARVSAERGREHVPDALRSLDEGITALGALATLQSYAIELELQLGHTEAALERLDTVAAQHPRRPEIWLSRRGEILERSARNEEARLAYERALAAIDALPPRHRKTRATLELERRARDALVRLKLRRSRGTL
jgi:tetratricopeptide (TPR) repeat protein